MMTSDWAAKVRKEMEKNPLYFIDGKQTLNAGHNNNIKCAGCFSASENIGRAVNLTEITSFGLDTCCKCRRVISKV